MGAFFGGLRSPNNTQPLDVYLVQSLEDFGNSSIVKREGSFYPMKVTSALAEVLARVLEGTDLVADTPEMKTWRGLRARAKKVLRESIKPEVETPDSELQPLGSAGGLEATERFVDYDLATRSHKPSRITRQ